MSSISVVRKKFGEYCLGLIREMQGWVQSLKKNLLLFDFLNKCVNERNFLVVFYKDIV